MPGLTKDAANEVEQRIQANIDPLKRTAEKVRGLEEQLYKIKIWFGVVSVVLVSAVGFFGIKSYRDIAGIGSELLKSSEFAKQVSSDTSLASNIAKLLPAPKAINFFSYQEIVANKLFVAADQNNAAVVVRLKDFQIFRSSGAIQGLILVVNTLQDSGEGQPRRFTVVCADRQGKHSEVGLDMRARIGFTNETPQRIGHLLFCPIVNDGGDRRVEVFPFFQGVQRNDERGRFSLSVVGTF